MNAADQAANSGGARSRLVEIANPREPRWSSEVASDNWFETPSMLPSGRMTMGATYLRNRIRFVVR